VGGQIVIKLGFDESNHRKGPFVFHIAKHHDNGNLHKLQKLGNFSTTMAFETKHPHNLVVGLHLSSMDVRQHGCCLSLLLIVIHPLKSNMWHYENFRT
jgi:hypothetical protein